MTSERIKTIIDYVEYESVADIGTDHGYIPIEGVLRGSFTKVIACDINPKPLEKAKANIKAKGYDDIIQTRLGDGLTPIKPKEVEAVIIAGMGGMLIIDILEQGKEVVKCLKQLILCPQMDVTAVRLYIHKIGFKITKEKIMLEKGKFYNIITCEKGAEDDYTETEYLLGKILIDSKDACLKKYLKEKMAEQKVILGKIRKTVKVSAEDKADVALKERIAELEYLNNIYERVMKCL